MRTKLSHTLRIAALLVVCLAAVTMLAPAAQAGEPENTKGFRKAVKLAGVLEHEAAFQAIADANNGNRASGTSGYDASAQYVFDRLTAAGYSPTFQEFTFFFVGDQTPPHLDQVSPIAKTYTDGVDFATMQYSGSGDVTAQVVAVDLVVPSPAPNTSTSGCEAADFAGFPAGAIALLQRGTCTFRIKATNAQAAGAAGVIVFNEGNPGRTAVINGTLSPPPMTLPVVGASFALGDELRNGVLNGATGVVAHLKTDTLAETRSTRNVIAETATGDDTRTIVIGAHLDSVPAGPALDDNGSGSATILEIAEVYAAQARTPRNKLRFIWFAAEEFGLVGSSFYVNSLSQAERDNIMVNLNFDMIASSNYVRFVYDGDGSDTAPPGPSGSGFVEQVFLDYFGSQGLATDPTALSGSSDYAPFMTAGIPVGGLFAGATGIKTPQQAAVYGGTAGDPYEPCYHLACETYDHLNQTVLDQIADGAAHSILVLSKTKEDVRGISAALNNQSARSAESEYLGDRLVR